MASRIFRYADGETAGTGETVAGGASSQFLIYQTTVGTPPTTMVGGTGVGMVMGPEEDNKCIAAYANTAVNSAGANDVTYDVEFYGSGVGGQAEQLVAINAALFQADADGVDIGGVGGYPFTSGTPATAAAEVNNDTAVPILVILEGTINV